VSLGQQAAESEWLVTVARLAPDGARRIALLCCDTMPCCAADWKE
jgi:hypothetical protein